MRFGFSVSAHYRLLKSPEDVAELVSGLCSISQEATSLELSYHNIESLDLFSKGYYLAKKHIIKSQINDISIHFLRNILTADHFRAATSRVKETAEEYGVKDIVIHYGIYEKFREQIYVNFVESGYTVFIENTDRREVFASENADVYRANGVGGMALDLCHFRFDDANDLKFFLETYPADTIREIQFSHLNHELFLHGDDIKWLRKRLRIVRKHISLKDVRFICEGTYKEALSVQELISALRKNDILLRACIRGF